MCVYTSITVWFIAVTGNVAQSINSYLLLGNLLLIVISPSVMTNIFRNVSLHLTELHIVTNAHYSGVNVCVKHLSPSDVAMLCSPDFGIASTKTLKLSRPDISCEARRKIGRKTFLVEHCLMESWRSLWREAGNG
jgi:hypothetical protein